MQIEVFVICDAATADTGKLSILGVFDAIGVAKLPAIHPQFTIALRIRFNSIERGEHKIALNLIDEDGKELVPKMDGVLNINVPEGQLSASANFIMNLQRIKIDKAGEYSVNLAVDSKHVASLPLFVRMVNQQSTN